MKIALYSAAWLLCFQTARAIEQKDIVFLKKIFQEQQSCAPSQIAHEYGLPQLQYFIHHMQGCNAFTNEQQEQLLRTISLAINVINMKSNYWNQNHSPKKRSFNFFKKLCR